MGWEELGLCSKTCAVFELFALLLIVGLVTVGCVELYNRARARKEHHGEE